MRLSARRAAVLGRPVAHSLSPVLHTAAYRALGLDWTYEAIDCGVDELAGVLADRADWAGFSCTMPLKRAALAVAASVAPVARAVGVANTLVPGADGWVADNTDVAGIVSALAEYGVGPGPATILGAGGTAQAALAALLTLGMERVTVLVRDPARTADLRGVADGLGVTVEVGRLAPDAPELAADLVVSTLPPHAADAYAARPWTGGQTLLDVAYAPWPSAVAAAAAARGATIVSGALMLLHQAAAQVSLMTGAEAPVAEMRLALDAAAPGCGV